MHLTKNIVNAKVIINNTSIIEKLSFKNHIKQLDKVMTKIKEAGL